MKIRLSKRESTLKYDIAIPRSFGGIGKGQMEKKKKKEGKAKKQKKVDSPKKKEGELEPSLSAIVKMGYVVKQTGRAMKGKKRRFAVLRSDSLEWYASKGNFKKGNGPLGRIELRVVIKCERVAHEKVKRMFCLQCPGRDHVFIAADEKEYEGWLLSLQSTLDSVHPHTSTDRPERVIQKTNVGYGSIRGGRIKSQTASKANIRNSLFLIENAKIPSMENIEIPGEAEAGGSKEAGTRRYKEPLLGGVSVPSMSAIAGMGRLELEALLGKLSKQEADLVRQVREVYEIRARNIVDEIIAIEQAELVRKKDVQRRAIMQQMNLGRH